MAEVVVAFPKRDQDKVVWRCNCGCMSFLARADGELECCHCQMVVTGDIGEWRSRLPQTPDKTEEPDSGDQTVTDLGSSSAALRRALDKADADNTAAVIVLQKDGAITAWGDVEPGEQAEWLDRRIADARQLLVGQEAANGTRH